MPTFNCPSASSNGLELDGLEYHMGLKRLAANSLGNCNQAFHARRRISLLN